MILKLCGITAIFLACTAAGFAKSFSLERRQRELETFLSAISFISTEIRYFESPTDVIIDKLARSDEYKKFRVFGLCRDKLSKTRDFAASWKNAVKESLPFLSLDKGDADAVLCFGSSLGTTDAEGQTANCERYSELLRQRIKSARDDRAKRGRMYSSLGILSGVFFALIFY